MLKGLLKNMFGAPQRDETNSRAVAELLERGVAHGRAGRATDAERCFLAVLRHDPRNADALNFLGILAFERAHYDTALAYFQDALATAGEVADYHSNRGLALEAVGRLPEAKGAYRQAIALAPTDLRYRMTLLFALAQDTATSPIALLDEHKKFAQALAVAPSQAGFPAVRFADPERRLRIGYVSGDFRMHAVTYFIEPLLTARDRSAFEVYCYQTVAASDARTDRFRAAVDRWALVWDLDDDEFAALIRADQVDVLVDLSGLTKGNRVGAFARQPAPVQVSYLGYLATTGIEAIRYRITDAYADPPGDNDDWYTERLVRLPRSFWCFAPPAEMPQPLDRGTTDIGPIVFGSFNRLGKVRPAVLGLWARLLAAVPDSELWVVDVPSDELHERIAAELAAAGVARTRLKTWPRLPAGDYWNRIRNADIALDTFPYNGGATTCECLWLGVPVVTRAGAMGFARSGASILRNAGLPQLVADSDEQYVAIAATLATDRARLRALQRTLRDRMRASPLLDAVGFMRDLEHAYRQMWRTVCAAEQAANGRLST